MGQGGLGSVLGAGLGAGAGNAMGGGMGSMLGGGLGAMLPTLLLAVLGMLGGRTSAGQSGMHQLVDTMHAKGMGDVAQSWVGTEANQPITAAQVEQLLTPDQLTELAASSGLPKDQASQSVAAVLPDVVNTLTPEGGLPDHTQVQATTDQMQTALSACSAASPERQVCEAIAKYAAAFGLTARYFLGRESLVVEIVEATAERRTSAWPSARAPRLPKTSVLSGSGQQAVVIGLSRGIPGPGRLPYRGRGM